MLQGFLIRCGSPKGHQSRKAIVTAAIFDSVWQHSQGPKGHQSRKAIVTCALVRLVFVAPDMSERTSKPKGDCDFDVAVICVCAFGVISPKGHQSRKAIVTVRLCNGCINHDQQLVRKDIKAERRL